MVNEEEKEDSEEATQGREVLRVPMTGQSQGRCGDVQEWTMVQKGKAHLDPQQ
jgi:hypothetical protein